MPFPTSNLSSQNVIRDVHDPVAQALRTTATVDGIEIEIDAADGDSIAISDGTDTMVVNPNGSINAAPTDEALRVDTVSAALSYFGYAAPGTLNAASTWKIKRVSTAGAIVTTEWADGNNAYDNIWDNRAGLTYV